MTIQSVTIRFAILCLGITATLMGCSPRSDLSRAEVHGKVLLNGQPVGEGSIIFMPVDGNKGPTAGGGIKDGRYSIAKAQGPIVGKNRIELHSARLTGRKIPTPWDASVLRDEVVDDFSSPRFNRQSELFRNIEAGSNNLDFELTSQ